MRVSAARPPASRTPQSHRSAEPPSFWDSKPREIRKLRVDLGAVDADSVSEKTVAIFNGSSVPWHAASLTSSCGCVAHSIKPQQVDPNCNGVVSLEYVAPSEATRFHETVLVQFHENQAPQFLIEINGIVVPWCYATPQMLDFGEIGHQKSTRARRVVLKLRQSAEMNIDWPPQTPEWVEVKHADDSNSIGGGGPEGHGTVAVDCRPNFAPDASPGELTGAIVFTSSANPTDKCTLPVRATLAPRLQAAPGRLFLGKRNTCERFTTVISLYGECLPRQIEQSFVDERIRVTHGLGSLLQLETKVVAADSSAREVLIECRFTMPDTARFLTGNIVVSCDGSNSQTIPVTARVVNVIDADPAAE